MSHNRYGEVSEHMELTRRILNKRTYDTGAPT